MDIVDVAISDYSGRYSSEEPATLGELNRETYAKVLMPRMLSGHVQGRFLSMISNMISPSNILEIGTYTGYSAICLAEGLKENGKIHTIDINDELAPMVNSFIDKSGMKDKIKTYYGNAKDIIPTLNFEFDLVFIDADKINYSIYYDLVFEKVRKNGFIVADNVLWDGKILDLEKADKDTLAIHHFNEKIKNDNRVENVIATIRDGVMLIRKK
jgi:caffeoyl-CoA O-methyltransferase